MILSSHFFLSSWTLASELWTRKHISSIVFFCFGKHYCHVSLTIITKRCIQFYNGLSLYVHTIYNHVITVVFGIHLYYIFTCKVVSLLLFCIIINNSLQLFYVFATFIELLRETSVRLHLYYFYIFLHCCISRVINNSKSIFDFIY